MTALHAGPGPVLAVRKFRVPMRDVDQAGVIYFAAVYGWHEALFSSWMADIGAPLSRLLPRGLAITTVSSRAEYKRPLRLDDVVSLELRTMRMGQASFEYRTTCTKQGEEEVAVAVDTTHVWTVLGPIVPDSPRTMATEPIPPWMRDGLEGRAADVDLDRRPA